jgi:hypothetical protein
MEEPMESTAPRPEWVDPEVIQVEKPSTLPDTIDESKIPAGKEPQVFDQNTGMNVPTTTTSFMEKEVVGLNE